MVLLGATAVGKSDLLLQLASRLQRLDAVIINADSRQVYRQLDIGTAKPSPQLRAALPHQLVDVVEPDEQFTAGMFVRQADAIAADVVARGGLPVIAGGAGFYIRSFLFGLPDAPPADAQVRAALQERAKAEGIEALHRELARVDPPSAQRLHPRDTNRIVRALEVHHVAGVPLSSYRPATKARGDYTVLTLGLQRPRSELYTRIDQRVAAMFAAGLEQEVAALRERGFDGDAPGMLTIGYRELMEQPAEASSAQVRELIARNTRHYAKRQLTFFRSFADIRWLPADDVEAVAAAVQAAALAAANA